jgi:heat shock protein HslJ
LVATSVFTGVFLFVETKKALTFLCRSRASKSHLSTKHSKMKWIFTGFVMVLLTSSCKTAKDSMPSTTPLYDTKWSLKRIYDGDAVTPVDTKAFIRFDKAKGSAGGNGSCNSFGSTALLNGNEVSFKNIFSTKMYCDQVQQIETRYLKHLENANRHEIKDSSLFLYHDKQLLLEFIAE